MANVDSLTVKLQGQAASFILGGGSGQLKVWQPTDASMIAGNGVLLDVKGDDAGWFYDSSTDVVYLVSTEGDGVTLTRKGDYWQWLVGPNDFRTGDTDPAGTKTLTAQIVVERSSSGVRTRLTSDAFSLVIKRQAGFMPTLISGLLAWYDAYDLSEADAATIATWDDKSEWDRDLTEATNKPTKRSTPQGRPYAEFDGTNDLLASTLADAGLACTAFVVGMIDTYDATVRGFLQVGGTNGARLAFDNANLKGISGSDVANMTLPSLDTWFVACITKTASGAITVQKGTSAVTTTSSTNAVTVGTIGLGDETADAAADVGISEVIVYDSVLTTDQRERVIRHLMAKWQANG